MPLITEVLQPLIQHDIAFPARTQLAHPAFTVTIQYFMYDSSCVQYVYRYSTVLSVDLYCTQYFTGNLKVTLQYGAL